MIHYLTRAVLDRDAPEHALRPLLDPVDQNLAFDAHHRLMWTLFPDRGAKRDFLWRADDKGKFLILSARKPRDSRLFRALDSKPFTPMLSPGDRLAFALRANATKDRRPEQDEMAVSGAGRRPLRNRRVDVVMDAMQEQGIAGGNTGPNSRAERRMAVAADAAQVWLSGQGTRCGFSIDEMAVEDYRVVKLKRQNGKEATFGVLDLTGLLTVLEPDAFTNALLAGIGRAKAYGCGLMLVRRA